MKIFIIFPTQLFEDNPYLKDMDIIYLIEDPFYFTDKPFHKQKLVFHRASMKYYYNLIKKEYKNVHYITFDKINYKHMFSNASEIHVYDPIDKPVIKKLKTKKLIIHDTPAFLETRQDLEEYRNKYTNKKKYYHDNSFYKWQRKRLNILMNNDNKPILNKWSFDKDNRNPYDNNYKEIKIITYKNEYIDEANKYVQKHFPDNFGSIDAFYYPVTHEETYKHLKIFIKKKLETFGKYQDGISNKIVFGSHSVLSPMLNIGLITPKQVIDEIMKYYKKNKQNIVTVEAFIRQVIGWRSYVRFIYNYHGEYMLKMNYLKHKRKLPKSWYIGNTKIDIIDDMINKVNKYAYLHHIERLMVMGNFGLLNQIHPLELYNWFMICFIDSFEWVMVPNVFGMSQFALKDISMMTRPYFSSSNYIRKMSNYKNNSWFEQWDSLYWNFINKHKNILRKIYSAAIQVKLLTNMAKDKLNNYLNIAKKLLKKLNY
jgi:deoxyribodipyrimidine photolyase-related protein